MAHPELEEMGVVAHYSGTGTPFAPGPLSFPRLRLPNHREGPSPRGLLCDPPLPSVSRLVHFPTASVPSVELLMDQAEAHLFPIGSGVRAPEHQMPPLGGCGQRVRELPHALRGLHPGPERAGAIRADPLGTNVGRGTMPVSMDALQSHGRKDWEERSSHRRPTSREHGT